MAAADWCKEWRDHAPTCPIRCLEEQTHRPQITRELADALRWGTWWLAVRAAAGGKREDAETMRMERSWFGGAVTGDNGDSEKSLLSLCLPGSSVRDCV
jgi:hypothetical protein